MRDDRRPRLPLLDAARGHLRVTAHWAMWFPFLIPFVMLEGYVRWKLGVGRFALPILTGFLVGWQAAVLGAYRAIVFHPRYDTAYRDWLAQTPWTAAKPLPRGPIHLVWPDGLVVVVLILIGLLTPDVEPMRIVSIYLLAYCAATVSLTLATLTFVPAYLAFFCMGFMARFWSLPWVCGALGLVSYLVVYWGIRSSLKSFPWSQGTENGPLSEAVALALGGAKKDKLGWPYERLLVQPARAFDERKLVTHSFIVCLLLGWWISCLAAHAADPVDFLDGMRGFGYMIAFFGSLFRLAAYVSGYAPPISLAGRITARRLLVPGYDAAFLVFPLMFLAPETVVKVGEALGVSPMVYAPIIPPLVLFIALATPPGLRQWRLTGRHRMVAAISAQDKNYVKVG